MIMSFENVSTGGQELSEDRSMLGREIVRMGGCDTWT